MSGPFKTHDINDDQVLRSHAEDPGKAKLVNQLLKKLGVSDAPERHSSGTDVRVSATEGTRVRK